MNESKYSCGQDEVTFLGYTVSAKGTRPLVDKIKAIQDFPPPKTVKGLRRFLPHAAEAQAPLHDMLSGPLAKGSIALTWTTEQATAFTNCKTQLCHATLLSHLAHDAPLALTTDASNIARGAVLQQEINGEWHSAYDRELLAIYESVKHFKHIVNGKAKVLKRQNT